MQKNKIIYNKFKECIITYVIKMFNKKILKTEISTMSIYDRVFFVLYSINRSSNKPFLILHLCKDSLSDPIHFPTCSYSNINESTCKEIVNNLFIHYKQYIDDICYSGYINNDQLYLFYEIKWNTYEAEYLDTNSPIFPVLMDEILNQHRVYNVNIHHEVTAFFINNPDIIYLLSDENVNIEYPIVTYKLDEANKIPFISMFGVSKDLDGKFGPYFYFKSYKKNMEYLNNNTNVVENKKYGILRCAVFTDNMTVDQTDFIHNDKETLYINGEYIMKNWSNHIPVSYHYIK